MLFVMKVLILCAHRPARSPSQRYRFEQYLPYLQQQGFSFTYSYLLNEKDDRLFYSAGRFGAKVWILFKSLLIRLRDMARFRRYDVIFIQREALFLGTSFVERRAFHSGTRVIFDFDDSIWLADTSPGNKKWEWIKRPEKFFSNVKHAHLVMAGNAYLAAKALAINKNTIVVPTTIDTDVHIPKRELRGTSVVCLGWSGSTSTIKHFETLIPVLQRLKATYGSRIRVCVVGDVNYRCDAIGVESYAWQATTEVELLNSFDIGLMPLPDDAWSRGKCGLKGLSYMACGVATVMSPVGVNTAIIRHGENGYLAGSADEWFNLLSTLIEDAALRDQLGRAGRDTVVQQYSVLSQRQQYLDAFMEQVNLRL